MHCRRVGARIFAALLLTAWSASSAAAATPTTPIGGGGVGTIDTTTLDCIKRTAVSFTATPNPVQLSGSSTLSWSISVPGDCQTTLTSPSLNGSPVGLVGSKSVQLMSNTEYLLQMIAGRSVANLGQLTVTVQLPREVHIKGNTPDWRGLLIQALSTPNTTIYLASNVDMDLSGEAGLIINEGVSVIGGEPCAPVATTASATRTTSFAGSTTGVTTTRLAIASSALVGTVLNSPSMCGGRSPQTFGPRLYTTNRPKPLFDIPCDSWGFNGDVRLEGFRIQGPHWGPEEGDDNLERGIGISSCKNIDIGNMELSGFSGAAVYITDYSGLSAPDAVKVHNSFIHHNQHVGGDGYGVDVSHGAWALIQRNVFDFNRHAVTAGSVVGNTGQGGWTAEYNLILKGGGYHGKWYENWTQIFDVHGDNNCVDGLPESLTPGGIWNCGKSGRQYQVKNNAFQYTNANSFKLRGTPSVGAFVENNVFARSTSDVVGTDGWGTTNLFVGPNTDNLDTFGKYQVCDFDRDGHDDLFLATGTSWWYMSSAKRQWTYLNSLTDTPDQVALVDLEGDGSCDVFAVHGNDWMVSRGGTQPSQSLGAFGVPFDQLRFGHFTGGPRTEIFRRAPDGQWWLISPGVFGWTALQSSSFPLSQLHFGNFNGHGVTDVIALENGHWSVSWGGKTAWQPLNPGLSDSLDSVFIADLDGQGTDDIIRYNLSAKAFEVSVDGRTGWQHLTSVDPLAVGGGIFTGHFEGTKPAEILAIGAATSLITAMDQETFRRSQIFSRATGAFTPYGIYAY